MGRERGETSRHKIKSRSRQMLCAMLEADRASCTHLPQSGDGPRLGNIFDRGRKMSIIRSFCVVHVALCFSCVFIQSYLIIGRISFSHSASIPVCLRWLLNRAGREGGGSEGDKKRGEQQQSGLEPGYVPQSPRTVANSCNRITQQKRKKGTPAAQRRCLWLPIPPRRPFPPRSSRLHYHI